MNNSSRDQPDDLQSNPLPADPESADPEPEIAEDASDGLQALAAKICSLEQSGRSGANWFFWVAGLSLVNSIIWMSAGFHAFALFWMWSGFNAFRQLHAIEKALEGHLA